MKISTAVIDASYVMSWLLPDENTPTKNPVKKLAPSLLTYEVVNALKSAVVQKRIDSIMAKELLKEFEGWEVRFLPVNMTEVMVLAIDNKLSGYDASYVWLAREKRCQLLTWDRGLGLLIG